MRLSSPPKWSFNIANHKGKKMHAKALCLTLICLAITPTAVAADKFATKYSSYISLNTGRSNAPGTCTYLYATGATCSEKGTVFRLGYGYQFTNNWGLEVSYGDFGRAKEKGILPTTPPRRTGKRPHPLHMGMGRRRLGDCRNRYASLRRFALTDREAGYPARQSGLRDHRDHQHQRNLARRHP
ncbi:MAG: hypothetical protein OHK0054_06770 [Sideroxydans sp.]